MIEVVERAGKAAVYDRTRMGGDVHRQAVVLVAVEKRTHAVKLSKAHAAPDRLRAERDDQHRHVIGRIEPRQMRGQRREAAWKIASCLTREEFGAELSDLEHVRLKMRIERDVIEH